MHKSLRRDEETAVPGRASATWLN